MIRAQRVAFFFLFLTHSIYVYSQLNFTQHVNVPAGRISIGSFVAVDINGDGYLELFAEGHRYPGEVSIGDCYTQTGNLLDWTVLHSFSKKFTFATSFIADIDRSGRFSYLHQGETFTGSTRFTGKAKVVSDGASFGTEEDILSPRFYSKAVAEDFNMDGWVDYIVCGYNAQCCSWHSSKKCELYLNDGAGNFVLSSAALGEVEDVGGSYDGLRTCNFNGDGYPDLLICGFDTTTSSILNGYVYDPENGFQKINIPSIFRPSSSLSVATDCADINGDGLDDLVFVYTSDGNRYVAYSYALSDSPTFSTPQLLDFIGSNYLVGLKAIDWNFDGSYGLLLASGTTVKFFNSAYSPAGPKKIGAQHVWNLDVSSTSGIYTTDIMYAAADFDNDGDIDVVYGSDDGPSSQESRLLINRGSNTPCDTTSMFPENLRAEVDLANGYIWMQWDFPYDASCTFDYYVATGPGGSGTALVNSLAYYNLNSSIPIIPRDGNARSQRFALFIPSVDSSASARAQIAINDTLYWSVRVMSAVYKAGQFAPEQSIFYGFVPPDGPTGNSTTGASDPTGFPAGGIVGILGGGTLLFFLILLCCFCCLCIICIVLIVVVVVVVAVIVLVIVLVLGVGAGSAGATAFVFSKGGSWDDSEEELELEDYGDFAWIPMNEIVMGKKIGKGAFGTVYQGIWDGKVVALKQLKIDAMDKEGREEFLHEVEIMHRMGKHQNLVQFIGAVKDGDNLYQVTTFYRHGSLDDYLIKKGTSISMEQGLQMALDAARGIAHLHSQGIVHRDIAARNCLLGKDMRVVVSDFGTARYFDFETEEGVTQTTFGPVRWMAPESIFKKTYSKHSDSWMFGCFLLEMVTLKAPYPSLTNADVIFGYRDPDFHPEIPDEAHEAVADIMRGVWKRVPQERLTVDQVCDMLEAALASTDTSQNYMMFDASVQYGSLPE